MHRQQALVRAAHPAFLMFSALAALAWGCVGPADDSDSADDGEDVGSAEEAVSNAVWRGDVQVSISATKNAAAQQITYAITVKNLGDDDARNIVISHTPSYFDGLAGMSFASVSASQAVCQGSLLNNAVLSVACNPITLAVGASETVKVIVNNPGNPARTGTAQAMGITPDPVPANNHASINVP